MPTRADFAKLNALIAEALALCEAAQERFVQINEELQQTIRDGRKPPVHVMLEEDRARRGLFDARVHLSERQDRLKRLVNED